ncbi:hypothetical protein CHARACLAT_033702 [Characodon lateralis]|uniref:Uncharacterized protein n=1 Tax=Characodon lateralis TaxID=208331 RepID=A0ABU7DFW9_9TELE|nr:hypothetical protein [Characodon lateralis]
MWTVWANFHEPWSTLQRVKPRFNYRLDSPLHYPGIGLTREAEECDPPIVGTHAGSAGGLLRGATLGGSALAKGPRLSAGFSTARAGPPIQTPSPPKLQKCYIYYTSHYH